MKLESEIWSEVMSDDANQTSAEDLDEDQLDYVLTKRTVSITDFKKHPNKFLRLAGGEPFAVMTNNRPSFYVLSPERYDELLEREWETEIAPVLLERMNDGSEPIKVRLEDLA